MFRDLADFMLKKPEFVVYRGQDLKEEPEVGVKGVGKESHAGYRDGGGDTKMESVADGSQSLDGSVVMDVEGNEHASEGRAGQAVKEEVVVRELQVGEVVVMPSKAAVRREEEAHKRTHEGETFVDAFMQQQSSYFPFKNTTVINGRVAVGNAFIVHDDKEELVCPAGWWEDLESPASDTYLSPRSVEAALAAAEIVCKAVDLIYTGAADGYAISSVPNVQNVFCCVRPPGHHSGRYGNTAGCGQNGFCLLNNVAIGATYGRVKHGLRRVAVIDIDAHFGNGTAEILSNDPHSFYASVHLQYETPGRFFPSSACCTIGKDITSPNLVLVNVYPPNSKTSTSNMFSKSKVPRGRGGFRRALSELVYPAVRAFEPDIIFVSAGFDGSHTDPIGGHLGLRPEDFHHISREIRELADEVCGGRIVSVLEGGYDLDAKTDGLATCVEAHVLALAGLHRN
jgi:acetoin utilization deacetylase AcuC-like enzyme